MKNARRAAAAGHKTTQRRRRPPVRRRTALVHIDNLSPDCTEALLKDYLLSEDVSVLSCYTAKSWLRDEEKEQVSAFRVTLCFS